MNDKNTGPEFAPLRNYVKEFKIIVDIIDKDDNVIRTEQMDYGKPEDRIWLGRLSFWAWDNGYLVETHKAE